MSCTTQAGENLAPTVSQGMQAMGLTAPPEDRNDKMLEESVRFNALLRKSQDQIRAIHKAAEGKDTAGHG
jgi:hypothetical protein